MGEFRDLKEERNSPARKPGASRAVLIPSPSPFKNRSKLSPDHVPERLVNREDEFRGLVGLFKPVLEGGASQRVMIHGPGGSGKTALARTFVRELESAAEGRNLNLSRALIDCRECRTQFQVARRLADIYRLSLPPRGRSTYLCLDLVAERLEDDGSHLVLILDWLDFLILRSDSDLLYLLTRFWEDRDRPNRISVIGISRVPDLTRFVDAATRSTFMHNRIEMDQYSEQELRRILQERSEAAFKAGAVEEETLDLISKDAPWEDGAGYAIEWLRQAGEAAAERADETVTPLHALEAKARAHPGLSGGVLERLDSHELFILSALTRKLKGLGPNRVSTGELEEGYRAVCGEHNAEPRSHPKFLDYVRGLSDLGIIESKLTFRGRGGITHSIGCAKGPVETLKSVLERFSRAQVREQALPPHWSL